MKNANYEEFKKVIANEIGSYLPEEFAGADIQVRDVVKNNGQQLSGLCVARKDSNISPNIYLEDFYRGYQDGAPIGDILKKIAEIITANSLEDFDMNSVLDLSKSKKKISLRLVNTERNAKQLKNRPHREVEDLSLIYVINVRIGDGMGSIPIDNKILDKWGISESDLYAIALKNSHPTYECEDMRSTLAKMMGCDIDSLPLPATPDQPLMNVISNKDKNFGVAAIADPTFMDEMVERYGEDFFILPSSVHEALLVVGALDVESLRQMVREVNDTQVAPLEILSYNVYRYDSEAGQLRIA